MDLRDATLMMLTESDGHPELERLARLAYDTLADHGEVHYDVLSDLLGEASGSGVLGILKEKYSTTAYEAMLMPIFREIGLQKPIMSHRRAPEPGRCTDPLTAPAWPS
jgi:hypothetical protein